MATVKVLYVALDDNESDAVLVSLGGPCPCDDGTISFINWDAWTVGHSDGRLHELPEVVLTTKFRVHRRTK